MEGILITGIPHGGTRLIVELLSKHKGCATYHNNLNSVNEFSSLHNFYIQELIVSDFKNELISVNKQNFFNVLDRELDKQTDKTSIVKMPVYPLHHLNDYFNYFDSLKIIYAYRPYAKVISSYIRRNEIHKQFDKHADICNQLKKISKEKRLILKDNFNFNSWVEELFRLNDSLIGKAENNVFKIDCSKINEKSIDDMFNFLDLDKTLYQKDRDKILSVVNWNKTND